ncbi:hypothetical protein [Solilutibacter tolerans]|uniref:Uncharacterized protein n=1 Tax=Solilutibacter tolerans TaxID=1604334 RepID=A0A1N6XH15_9GAMM|nr:hypothetical protein [Lysobacter tolerans]SIR01560.1 hypothetical protein SAMN05421546_2235 [Lysobacter tolerans]
MASNQQLVDRLYDLTTRGEFDSAEFSHLDALVYSRLEQTYADDEAFEAAIQSAGSVDLAAIAQAA